MSREANVVIDLCQDPSSSEDESMVQARPEEYKTPKRKVDQLPAAVSLLSGESDTFKSKRQKASEQSNELLTAAVVFLRPDGGDHGVITQGVDNALSVAQQRNPTVRTCCAISPASSSSIGKSTARKQRDVGLFHVQQKDSWTCGYRNLQMLLAALVPTLDPHHLFLKTHASNVMVQSGRVVCFEIPSQPELESELEATWRAGFDPNGAQHYGSNVSGRRKWIGAVEVWSILAAAGIDSCVVQFIRCSESRAMLGPFCSRYFSHVCPWCDNTSAHATSRQVAHSLLDKVKSIDSSHTGCGCSRLPLYLQWEGHSVTVVGVEHSPSGKPLNLLIMDPSKKGEDACSMLRTGNLKSARLSLSKLHTKDCQVILPSRHVVSVAEQEKWKKSLTAMCVTASSNAVKRHMGR